MTTDKARSLTEQIESSVNQLATETDEARKSELFKNGSTPWLAFSSYSFNNQLLIAFQRPAASTGQVAGFHAWRKLGRHVKKGAKGIAILAPCVYRKKADDTERRQSHRQTPLADSKPPTYFAEADTEGEPLPTLTYGAESGGDELLARLEWITEEELNIMPRLRRNHRTRRRRLFRRRPHRHPHQPLAHRQSRGRTAMSSRTR